MTFLLARRAFLAVLSICYLSAISSLAFEGESQVFWFQGNYQDYEEDRRKRLGAEADQPHRIRYKPLRRHQT